MTKNFFLLRVMHLHTPSPSPSCCACFLGSTRCASKLEAGQFVVRVYCSQSRCGKKQEEREAKKEGEQVKAAQVQVLNLKLIAQQILAKFRFHCAPKICLCLIRGNFLLFFWSFLFHLLHRFRLFLLLRVVFSFALASLSCSLLIKTFAPSAWRISDETNKVLRGRYLSWLC